MSTAAIAKSEHETVKVIYYVIMIVIASEENPGPHERNANTTLAMHKYPCRQDTHKHTHIRSQTHAIHLIGLCSVQIFSVMSNFCVLLAT